MKGIIVVSLAVVCFFAICTRGSLHASCKIYWTWALNCSEINDLIVKQIKKWYTSATCKDGGEKCLYTLKEVSDDQIKATHETPKHHYVDDLTFTFKTNGSELCSVETDDKVTPVADEYEMEEMSANAAFWGRRNTGGKPNTENTSKKGSKKLSQKLDSSKVIREWEESCCRDNCIREFPISYIIKQREFYWGKDTTARREFLLNRIRESKVLDADKRPGGSGPSEKRHFLEGISLCITGWCKVYGIARTCYFDRAKENIQTENQMEGESGRSKSIAFEFAVAWMNKFVLHTDAMPTNGVRNLPSCLTKLAVYHIYSEDMAKANRPIIARSTFLYSMWRTQFPDVVIPKQSRFTKCAICVHIKEELGKGGGITGETRRRLSIMRNIHLTQQLAERKKYYKHGMKAKSQPDQYLSLTVDGMDQAKHNLPHFTTTTKIDDHAWKLKTHVTGVLVNYHTKASAFIDCCQFPHDSNLTINILLHSLLWIQSTSGRLPPTLYLQMDNCWRENKNRFVLCFLAVLIEMGIFTKIKISFLMVGHTHEDIDQMFSCISRRLSKNNARTLVELIREIGLSYTPVIEVDILTYMYDVRRWLEECIVPNLSGHIHQHQFKLVKGPDGKALLFYKKWSTSPAWQPAQGLHIVNGRPKGVPELIDQDKSQMNFAKMAQDLPKYRIHFDSDTTRWWERFIENEGPEESRPKWILPFLEAQQPPPLEAGVGCDPGINEGLLSLVEREEREVEVTVGRKRKTGAKQGQRKKKTWKT